jgi:hypothetical protein
MKAKDISLILVVVVLVAFTPNSPISVLARDVLADARPAPLASPVGTAFTYQGQLTDAGVPADGVYDFQFTLWDAETFGSQIGSPVTRGDVVVASGVFAVELDFGASAFAGEARWLEIGVRPGDSSGSYTTLDPRQKVMPTPYAIHSLDADTIDGAHAASFAGSSHDHMTEIWTGTGAGLGINSGDTALAASSSAASAGAFENPEAANSASTLTTWTAGTGWALEAGSTAADPKAGQFTGDVEISGDLNVDGAASGFFPRPAYDSGWYALGAGGDHVFVHDLGGEIDSYLVDMTCKDAFSKILNTGIGGDVWDGGQAFGFYYHDLTSTVIKAFRRVNDTVCDGGVRIRIWVIN